MESEEPSRGSPPPFDQLSAVKVAFPQTQEDFDNDPRVSYSRLDERWILEEDDGTEWEFNEKLNKWTPSLDEALLEKQQEAYAVHGVDENEPAQPHKKRKATASNGDSNDAPAKPKKQRQSLHPTVERKNTAVYVTSLPLDATVDEIHSVFSKCGVIAEEIDSRKPRIKLYTDDDGNFKGDALVLYFRPESVKLAIQMLDDSDFRFGQSGPSGNMRVSEADRSYKKQQDNPKDQETKDAENARKKMKSKDQKKIIKKTQIMNNKLADWSDDDTAALTETSERYDKVVVLKHMFTLQELNEDPAAILEIKEDIRDECSKLGEVTNVVLMDGEPDGVSTVRFSNAEAAKACVRLMNGRMFGGQAVEAYIADPSERFKKSKKKSGADLLDDEDEEDEESNRLDNFGKYLEGEEA